MLQYLDIGNILCLCGVIRKTLEDKNVRIDLFIFIFFRAHGGDKNGSLHLQAFAALLQEHYLKTPLNQIHLMVKRAMRETPQVGYFLNCLQYFFKVNCRVVHVVKHVTLKTISQRSRNVMIMIIVHSES